MSSSLAPKLVAMTGALVTPFTGPRRVERVDATAAGMVKIVEAGAGGIVAARPTGLGRRAFARPPLGSL